MPLALLCAHGREAGHKMKLITCNPLAFVQSLSKAQRKALAEVLDFPQSKDGKEGPTAMLRKALAAGK